MQRRNVETVGVVHQLVCDRCGKEAARNESEFHEMTSIDFKAGYGSIFGDGNRVEIDLCQHCLRDTLGTWLRVKDEADRERAIGRLARRVQAIVEASGNPDGFDAIRWTEAFLLRPMPALGGKTPNEFMGTEEGQTLIENLISRMQSGGYS